MAARIAVVAALGLSLLGGVALADDCPRNYQTTVYSGFSTGSTFAKAGDQFLESYVVGYADAMLAAMLIGAPSACVELASQCLVDREPGQLVAMFRKYLDANPERWHQSASVLLWNAIIAPCFAVVEAAPTP